MKRYLLSSNDHDTVIVTKRHTEDGGIEELTVTRKPWVTVRLVTGDRRQTLSGFAGTPADISEFGLTVHAEAIAQCLADGSLVEVGET
jgi:hypothetical protein